MTKAREPVMVGDYVTLTDGGLDGPQDVYVVTALTTVGGVPGVELVSLLGCVGRGRRRVDSIALWCRP
jgi:hypothetical protein